MALNSWDWSGEVRQCNLTEEPPIIGADTNTHTQKSTGIWSSSLPWSTKDASQDHLNEEGWASFTGDGEELDATFDVPEQVMLAWQEDSTSSKTISPGPITSDNQTKEVPLQLQTHSYSEFTGELVNRMTRISTKLAEEQGSLLHTKLESYNRLSSLQESLFNAGSVSTEYRKCSNLLRTHLSQMRKQIESINNVIEDKLAVEGLLEGTDEKVWFWRAVEAKAVISRTKQDVVEATNLASQLDEESIAAAASARRVSAAAEMARQEAEESRRRTGDRMRSREDAHRRNEQNEREFKAWMKEGQEMWDKKDKEYQERIKLLETDLSHLKKQNCSLQVTLANVAQDFTSSQQKLDHYKKKVASLEAKFSKHKITTKLYQKTARVPATIPYKPFLVYNEAPKAFDASTSATHTPRTSVTSVGTFDGSGRSSGMDTMPPVLQMVAASVNVAHRAGRIIRDIMKTGDLGIIDKGGMKNVQTEADRSGQRCIMASLHKQFSKASLFGEEDYTPEDCKDVPEDWVELTQDKEVLSHASSLPASLANVREEDIVVWIDPLDGTAEYTEGLLDHVTVLIGICVNNRAVGGVIYQPYYNYKAGPGATLGRVIWGIEGIGAFGYTPNSAPEGENIITTTRSHSQPTVVDSVQACKPTHVLKAGGAGHKVLLVLEGHAHAYVFGSPGCKKWDTAAPEAILNAAGGYLTDIHGNQLPYNANCTRKNTSGVLAVPRKEWSQWYIERIPQHVKDELPFKP